MDQIISFFLLAWLAVIVIGVLIALMPVIAFVAGFLGMILLVSLIGRLVGAWLFF